MDHIIEKTPMDVFMKHDISSFSEVITIFGNSFLETITPEECDFAFHILLRDIKLYYSDPTTWCTYAQNLCNTIQHLTEHLSVNSKYLKEYARYMTEREQYRTFHENSAKYISEYNQIVIKWRFP